MMSGSTTNQSSFSLGQPVPKFGQAALAFGQTVLSFVIAFGQSVLSSVLAFGQSVLAFGQTVLAFGQYVLAYGQTVLAFGQSVLASGAQPSGKPKSVSDNGKSGIESKMNESDMEALMPKLRHSYYTKPTILELAAKEQAEPGYCGRVKDFEVGRHGLGSIKFLGETDLRGLDLEYFIKIDHGGLVYAIGIPSAGHGFKGKAEMTVVIEKHDCDTQPTIDYFKKRAEDEGAEFVSYDPITREFKCRMEYLSRLGLILFYNNKHRFV